ncbi:MAG: tetratricopeptide repeat protein [Planctomycetota bacterium]
MHRHQATDSLSTPHRDLIPLTTWRRASWRRAAWQRAMLSLFAGLVAIGLASQADAQLTATALIGDSVSSPDSPRYSDVNEAIKRFTNRDILSARQFLESAKRKDPKLPPVGVMLAKMYAISGNSNAVRPALEQSIDAESDDPEPYLLLAESTLAAGQTIEADALFDKSVQLVGKYDANAKRKRNLKIRAYRGRAAVAERRQNWQAAEADLRVWLQEDPDNANAHTRLGQVLCMLDRTQEGRQAFEKAKQLDDNLASPFVMTASMYERRGLQAEAIAEFEKAYAQNRDNEVTLVSYAQALIKNGNLPKAGQVLKTARAAAPDSFNVWLLTGVTARMAGSYDAAERAFKEALALQPGSRDAYDQMAQTLVAQDDTDKRARGLQYAGTNSKIYPNNADVKVTLAWALYQNGRSKEATAELRNALQTGGGALGADARVLVAKILIAGNQTENARRLLSSALTEQRGIFVQRAEAEKLLASLN